MHRALGYVGLILLCVLLYMQLGALAASYIIGSLIGLSLIAYGLFTMEDHDDDK